MTTPVITNVEVFYASSRGYKLPGEAAELLITAIDGDSFTITVDIKVRDSSGEESVASVEVVQSDPLTYEATSSSAVVTQDPAQPNHFYVV